MKIWEIDRSVVGKIYRIGRAGRAWTVNDKGNIVLKSNGKLIEEYHTLSNILELNFMVEKQFSKDEKTIARNFPKEFEYAARDEDEELWLYKERPNKGECEWNLEWSPVQNINFFNHLFQQIQWEDDEPTLISDIII